MKKYRSSLTLLAVISVAVFILNMAVMYVLFDINVLNPKASLQAEIEPARTNSDEVMEATIGAKIVEKDTYRESDPVNQTETSAMPKSGAFDTASFYMTPDEIAFLSYLDMEDKLSAMTILSKLGTVEVERIYDMSHDGVTIAEFADINSSIESRLEVSDVEALKEILNRNKILYAQNSR